MKEFFFIYKTTNLINGRYYIGIHRTKNLEDEYLGSGFVLNDAIKKYGKANFKREILEFFNSYEEAAEAERNLVTADFIKDSKNYNICEGGGYPPRYEGIKHPSYGKKRPDASVRMKHNNPSKLHHVKEKIKDTVVVIDSDGDKFRVKKDDPRYLSGELIQINKGKVTVKDKNGNIFHCEKDDPRYLSGELIPAQSGKIVSEETRKRISESNKGRKKPSKIVECPYCKKKGFARSMTRYHFNKCKYK